MKHCMLRSRVRTALIALAAIGLTTTQAFADRRAVLDQIAVPHSYYAFLGEH